MTRVSQFVMVFEFKLLQLLKIFSNERVLLVTQWQNICFNKKVLMIFQLFYYQFFKNLLTMCVIAIYSESTQIMINLNETLILKKIIFNKIFIN